jgi:repressor LexA
MLTPRQKECLDFISRFLAEHGHGPSYDEIAAGLGVKSRGSISAMLGKLRTRGFLSWRAGDARSLVLTGKSVAPMPGDLPTVRLAPQRAAEIDALVKSLTLPSREAAVDWLLEVALHIHSHGSLPPCEARNAAPFAGQVVA